MYVISDWTALKPKPGHVCEKYKKWAGQSLLFSMAHFAWAAV